MHRTVQRRYATTLNRKVKRKECIIIMEFINFTIIVKNEIEKRAGKNYHVRLKDVRKNNGVILSGLTVMQDDSNISPTIYLNTYYEAYQSGQATLSMVIDDVMEVYERNRVNRTVDVHQFLNFDMVKNRIVYKLINTEKNRELLKDVPYIPFYDLSIVFQFLITEEHFGNATILIHNAHLQIWGISVEALYQKAQQNTSILNPYEIKNMQEVLCEYMSNEEEIGQAINHAVPVYVLSNRNRIFGAACMLYPELIQDFAQAVGSDLYIIPSSVHEVLLLPTQGTDEIEDIKRMVQEVNDTQVETEDVLSYSVYFFDKEKNSFAVL